MKIADNIIKEYLKNVYFISGTPCGGKTTISRALGKKRNIYVYDIDEMFPTHAETADKENQPSMSRQFRDADEFFGRSVDEYREWLLSNTREQLDFVILDLIRLSQKQKVICDCHLRPEEALRISDPKRVAFMLKEPSNLVDAYCNRPDHQGFSNFIHSATDVESAKRTCNETLYSLNAENYQKIKDSNFFWLERDEKRSVEEMVLLVEKHFGLSSHEDNINNVED